MSTSTSTSRTTYVQLSFAISIYSVKWLGARTSNRIHLIYLFSQLIDSWATKYSVRESTSFVRLLCALREEKRRMKLIKCLLAESMLGHWLIGRQLASLFQRPQQPQRGRLFFHCQIHSAEHMMNWFRFSQLNSKRTYQLNTNYML